MVEDDPLFLVLADWPINRREHLRVTIETFNGANVLNIRKWYVSEDDGELRPTKRGIAVSVKHVEQIADGLNAALAEARKRRLIPPANASTTP